MGAPITSGITYNLPTITLGMLMKVLKYKKQNKIDSSGSSEMSQKKGFSSNKLFGCAITTGTYSL